MRKAGILMPVFSLPSPHGIGTLGQAAREFIDFLQQAGQSCWQVLPISQTGYMDSPYQSVSSFAGNPYLIDLDLLAEEGLLSPDEYQNIDWGSDLTKVDYSYQFSTKYPILRKAGARLINRKDQGLAEFCLQNAYWLDDYALFMSIKMENETLSWFEWADPIRLREPEAIAKVQKQLRDEIECYKVIQYMFFKQWQVLKQYANERGIKIIGDLPIYVSGDSADVWANPQYFQLNADGYPTVVAGCPPDDFSDTGQLWGNPIFAWDKLKAEGYGWWIKRIEFQFQLYDTLRIDHFRGFDAYYSIPYGSADAKNGVWCEGPGLEFFKIITQKLGKRDIIAEDLGFLTDSVRNLLKNTGFPGMKVLEFAFDNPNEESEYLPHTYPQHCVVYAGTHDNDTIEGYMHNASKTTRKYAKAYLRLNKIEGYNWGMMRAGWASAANLAIMQFQDILGIGSEARINIPSTLGGNWQWRTLPGTYTPALAKKLYKEMQTYHRLPQPSEVVEQ